MPFTMTKTDSGYQCDFSRNGFKQNLYDLKEQVEGLKWNPNEKIWTAQPTIRNHNIYQRLQGVNIYALYDKPLMNDNELLEIFTQNNLASQFSSLRNYQRLAVAHFLTHRRCILSAVQRSGKTLPTLLVLKLLQRKNPKNRQWFVTTKNAKLGIRTEMKKWNLENNSLHIMTYDEFTKEAYDNPPMYIVFDECQKLKNDSSQRSMSAMFISKNQLLTNHETYLLMLSGTPAPNYPDDWWALTEICMPAFLREKSKMQLRQTLAVMQSNDTPFGGKYYTVIEWKKDEVKNLSERLSGLVEFITKEDVGNMTPMEQVSVDLTPERSLLNALKLIAKTRDKELEQSYRQLSDGFIYEKVRDEETGEITQEVKYLSTPKDAQLIDDLEEYEDCGRLCITGYFSATVEKIANIVFAQGWDYVMITGSGIKTSLNDIPIDELMMEFDGSRFSLKKVERLAIILQSDICEGLELSACPAIIFYSNTYNCASRLQMEARHTSPNSPYSSVIVKDYLYLAIDRRILQLLKLKTELESMPKNWAKELSDDISRLEVLDKEQLDRLKTKEKELPF